MQVRLKPGAWVDPAKMMDTIHRAGYTPMRDDVRLTLEGRIAGDPAQPLLSLDDVKPVVSLPLVADEKDPAPLAQVVEQLRSATPGAVQVEARWRPGSKEAPAGALVVTRVAPAAPPVK